MAFGIEIDKEVVRRILGMLFQPESGSEGLRMTHRIKVAKSPKMRAK